MSIKKIGLFCSAAALALSFSSTAQATPFEAMQTQILGTDGQDILFEFDGLEASDGTGGTLTVASGVNQLSPGTFDGLDLDGSSEFFDLLIDGIVLGRFACQGEAGVTEIPGNTGGIECDFTLPIAISATDLGTFLADGSIDVQVNFSDEVNSFSSSDQDEVIVSISYTTATQVSEPLTAGLFGLGLIGFAAQRRRIS